MDELCVSFRDSSLFAADGVVLAVNVVPANVIAVLTGVTVVAASVIVFLMGVTAVAVAAIVVHVPKGVTYAVGYLRVLFPAHADLLDPDPCLPLQHFLRETFLTFLQLEQNKSQPLPFLLLFHFPILP